MDGGCGRVVQTFGASGGAVFGYWPKAERRKTHRQTTVSKNERGALHQNPYSFLKTAVKSTTKLM
jgi:hypothetical protein